MDFSLMSRKVPPPPPEPKRLKTFRRSVATGLLTMAGLIAFLDQILALWKPLILLYPVMAIALLVATILFFRAKSRYYDSYWTEERRAEHYLKVRAGLVKPPKPEPPRRRWRAW